MEVLILTVFVSIVLVAGELVFFAWNIRQRMHDYSQQLSLLPLEDDLFSTPVRPHSGRALARREAPGVTTHEVSR